MCTYLPVMDCILIAALVGSLIFGGWLFCEVRGRCGEIRQVPCSERQGRSGLEGTASCGSVYWLLRVTRLRRSGCGSETVCGLEDQESLPVYVRDVGEDNHERCQPLGPRVVAWLRHLQLRIQPDHPCFRLMTSIDKSRSRIAVSIIDPRRGPPLRTYVS